MGLDPHTGESSLPSSVTRREPIWTASVGPITIFRLHLRAGGQLTVDEFAATVDEAAEDLADSGADCRSALLRRLTCIPVRFAYPDAEAGVDLRRLHSKRNIANRTDI